MALDRTLVMGILNVTPDSFSDGGRYTEISSAVSRAAEMIADGVDIIDIGGESTRPGSRRVSAEIEIERVVPVIEAICARFDVPISVDTSKSEVAAVAIAAGAEIVNDISGLRFDERIAEVAAKHKTGFVLMHSRGDFQTIHTQPPSGDIFAEVVADFHRSSALAESRGMHSDQLVLDVGVGFGKTLEHNLELIAALRRITATFPLFPILVGASRKSFIGKVLGDIPASERLHGSLAAAAIAAWNGAKIVRVHDVKETADVLKIVNALADSI